MSDTPVPGNECSLLSEDDLYMFNEGTHARLYEKLGAHPVVSQSLSGTYFAVWAPNAKRVTVIGDFNGWDKTASNLHPRGCSGIWESFIPGVGKGALYKYHIVSRMARYRVDKADPIAFFSEPPPSTASVTWDLDYNWSDQKWMSKRAESNALNVPIAIYEMHLGSWKRVTGQGNRPLTYREIAPTLADYITDTGFTHVELLPVMEHPFYGSWGYQTSGYFSPTSRYGSPQDFMHFIDYLHQRGIGVILDWVPSHFPGDEHGLGFFDGTHLYEHADIKKGIHPDWNSCIFNYARNEVRSFLLSSAIFWLDKYHIDGLRADAVSSMLYLDYSRKPGEWIPNEQGGRENLEAISLLRRFNETVYKYYPDVQTIAEESTAWPGVSRPINADGLGFGMKWDMGWMHDILDYLSRDPLYRKFHQDKLTFRKIYAFSENYVLPLSHDEVVHGKGSLLSKMPGDDWQKMANLRLLFAYMFAQPGKKLIFMGGEFGQWAEWDHEKSLDWHLLSYKPHQGIQKVVRALIHLYRNEPALFETDFEPSGFEWVDCNDSMNSVISFIRKGHSADDFILVVCNFTPIPLFNYSIGVPVKGFWREVMNTDAYEYGGTGAGNCGGITATETASHGRPYSLKLTLPPLSALFFKSGDLPR
jgi:1,4-alpha-glucan branching enzyme